jgi:hypothetical protein
VYDGTPPLAETLALYGEPCIPFTKLVVVMERAGVTVIDRFAVTVCGVGLESFTCTMKLVVPVAVGLPVMAPVALIDKPAGNTLPLASEKVSGGLPPVAVTVAVYELPTTPFGRPVVVICKLLATVIERTAVAVCAGLLASVAWTVKVVVPGAVGVPLIRPAALMVRPAGSALPLASENV